MIKKVINSDKKEAISQLHINIPSSLRKAFRVKLAEDDINQTTAICFLIEAYVKNKIKIEKV